MKILGDEKRMKEMQLPLYTTVGVRQAHVMPNFIHKLELERRHFSSVITKVT